jgi:alginate O-acetyltransferase complex protein AlgI
MTFSTVTFLFFFLPIFLATYFLSPSIRARNAIALLFSLIFYAWGEPRFLPALLASVAFNALSALGMDRCEGLARKIVLALAVAVNLLFLATFKYADFIAGNLDAVLHPLGIRIPAPHISLPIGISFFTFHCLSYVIDVYRRRFAASRDPVQVALYVTLFPQLVAGPIVRYKTVARQLRLRRSTMARASAGARIFIVGLAQKVLIADQVAQLAEAVFDRTPYPTLADAWLGLLSYSVQIYFDFAGYSNMAIGIGIILGFAFPRNFRLPYASLSVTEFWRRWHMSLSSWLRDYLYIPLGGSRGSALATYRNLVTVFLLCGLWHGASWNFVLWGAWHGAFLVLERVGGGRFPGVLPPMARWIYTLLVAMGGWVLFRSHDLEAAARLYQSLTGMNGTAGMGFELHAALQPIVMVSLAVGCALAVLPRWIRALPVPRSMVPGIDTAWTFGLLAIAMTFVASGVYSPFLYFRF